VAPKVNSKMKNLMEILPIEGGSSGFVLSTCHFMPPELINILGNSWGWWAEWRTLFWANAKFSNSPWA